MHPLTGSWKLVWNELRGVRHPMGHIPTYLTHISMKTLPMYPCIVTSLHQHIDVERQVWIDSLDVIIPDTETEASWTVVGRLKKTPDVEMPSMLEIEYERGRLTAKNPPAWLVEYTESTIPLRGRGKAMTVTLNDVYRLDRDMHQRSAYLERIQI